jgi:hypothetical protein
MRINSLELYKRELKEIWVGEGSSKSVSGKGGSKSRS